jgi:hypothetical protein
LKAGWHNLFGLVLRVGERSGDDWIVAQSLPDFREAAHAENHLLPDAPGSQDSVRLQLTAGQLSADGRAATIHPAGDGACRHKNWQGFRDL